LYFKIFAQIIRLATNFILNKDLILTFSKWLKYSSTFCNVQWYSPTYSASQSETYPKKNKL
jgi:hypothetical protein